MEGGVFLDCRWLQMLVSTGCIIDGIPSAERDNSKSEQVRSRALGRSTTQRALCTWLHLEPLTETLV
jgi:hypothetical protein